MFLDFDQTLKKWEKGGSTNIETNFHPSHVVVNQLSCSWYLQMNEKTDGFDKGGLDGGCPKRVKGVVLISSLPASRNSPNSLSIKLSKKSHF